MKATNALACTPTIVTGVSLILAEQYGLWAVASEFGLALASGAISFAAFKNELSPYLSWASAGYCFLSLQAAATSFAGLSWPSFYAWLVCSSVGLIGKFVYEHHTREDRHASSKSKAEQTKAEAAMVRAQAAMVKAQQGEAEQLPDLAGTTQQETDLRTAVFDVFAVELPNVFVECSNKNWAAVLDLPAALDRTKLKTQWHKVESAMSVEGSFVLADGPLTSQLVVKYLHGDPLSRMVPFVQPTARSFREPVVLGVDRFGDEVAVELAYNHTLIAGSSKFGKSNLVKKIALSLAALPDTILYGVDMKPGAVELGKLAPLLHDLAVNKDQARALFLWLKEEMQERGDILRTSGDTAWDPAKHGRPAVFVVVDEVAELVRQGDDVPRGTEKISKIMESLLALARAYGLHLILATQQPSNRVFGGATDARGNLAVRISTHMNDTIHSRFVFADSSWDANSLNKPGKFLMQSPDHTTPQPYKAQYVADDVATEEVERLSRELVPAPVGKRLVLPSPDLMSGQEKAMYALKRYGNMTRKELELATGLDDKQVLRALQGLKPGVERDEAAGTWRIPVTGAWKAQAVVSMVKQ